MKKLLAIILMFSMVYSTPCFGFFVFNPFDRLINKYPVKEYVKDGVFVVGTIQSMITLLSLTAATYHGILAIVDKEENEEHSEKFFAELKSCTKATLNTLICAVLFKALLEK
jgi:hypothetical protein